MTEPVSSAEAGGEPEELGVDEDCTAEMLQKVSHIPNWKLRHELAICCDELELIERQLDIAEGVEAGYSSLEVTSGRVRSLREQVEAMQKVLEVSRTHVAMIIRESGYNSDREWLRMIDAALSPSPQKGTE